MVGFVLACLGTTDEERGSMTPDKELLSDLARWLRKHDCGAFDDETNDQDRAMELVDWLAGSVDVLNVPPRKEDL